jgi:hypothetical protein
MKRIVRISLIIFAADLFAQSAIPAGTILPVALNSSLNSRKVKAGQVITARVMQDVPLSQGSTIHAGARVTGHVIEVKNSASGTQMSFRFDTLVVSKRRTPITTNLRALASMMAVEQAENRRTAACWFTSPASPGRSVEARRRGTIGYKRCGCFPPTPVEFTTSRIWP